MVFKHLNPWLVHLGETCKVYSAGGAFQMASRMSWPDMINLRSQTYVVLTQSMKCTGPREWSAEFRPMIRGACWLKEINFHHSSSVGLRAHQGRRSTYDSINFSREPGLFYLRPAPVATSGKMLPAAGQITLVDGSSASCVAQREDVGAVMLELVFSDIGMPLRQLPWWSSSGWPATLRFEARVEAAAPAVTGRSRMR